MRAIIPGASPVGCGSKGSVVTLTLLCKSCALNVIGVLQLNPNSFWEHTWRVYCFPWSILGMI